MTATEAILNYAMTQGGTFHRKDLLFNIANHHADIKASAITLQINRMIASGTLRRIGHGEYEIAGGNLPEYVYQPSGEEKDIYMRLKQQFPFLDLLFKAFTKLACSRVGVGQSHDLLRGIGGDDEVYELAGEHVGLACPRSCTDINDVMAAEDGFPLLVIQTGEVLDL